MTRPSKQRDLARLAEIAKLTDRTTGIYPERAKLVKRLAAAGVTPAELARVCGIGRADITKIIKGTRYQKSV